MEAIRKYDDAKGIKLATWAYRPIQWSILHCLQKQKECICKPLGEDDAESTQKQRIVNLDHLEMVASGSKTSVIDEYLPHDLLSKREKQMIDLKVQGYTLKEIDNILKINQYNKTHQIFTRLKEKIRISNES